MRRSDLVYLADITGACQAIARFLADVDYAAYYDGSYGPFYGGYWGPGGAFYYWDQNHGHYHRDAAGHFRREGGGAGFNAVRGHAPSASGGGRANQAGRPR